MSADSADRLAFSVLCGFASLAAGGGSATRTPCAFASLGGCGWGWSVRAGLWLSLLSIPPSLRLVGDAGLGWQDDAVKSSGSLWFGYGVVVVVTFVIGFLAFGVWVLSKVF